MHHIIAIADKGDFEIIETAAMLNQSKAIREHLAGME